jgi:hypothetical protein
MARLRMPVRLFAAVLAASVLLSGCGARYLTPAAVVDGRRITQDSLKEELRIALADSQTAQQAQGETELKALTRRVLGFLIQLQLIQEYATANRISVTPQEVDNQIQQAIVQVGGQAQFDQALRVRGLTLAVVRTNFQRQVLFIKVEDAVTQQLLGTSTAQQQQKDEAFTGWLQARLKAAHIEVNPRFGRLDPNQGEILPITSTEG